MTWAKQSPVTPGSQFWKIDDLDDGSEDVNFLYVLTEEAPITLSETMFITLTDTPDVIP